MSIQIQDYISDERITEIVEEELRQKLRNLDIVRDYFKHISYDLMLRVIREECHIESEELRSLLASQAKTVISGNTDTVRYELFRRDIWSKKPEGIGAKILDEVVEENRPLIVEAVNKAINAECMEEVQSIARNEAVRIVREKISDVRFMDYYYEQRRRDEKEREKENEED